MIFQNLKTTIRRLTSNLKVTILTLLGLIIGVASSYVILTKVRYEKSYDSFHTDAKNIYRVVRLTSGLEYLNGELEYRAGIQFPIPTEIKKNISEITDVTSVLYIFGNKISVPNSSTHKPESYQIQDGIVFADPDFFKVFDFADCPINWISGNKVDALKDVFSVVITRDIEQLLFKGKSAMGKTIDVGGQKYTVKGVISNFPKNSDFPFKILISFSTFTDQLYKGALTDWGSISDNFQCFVKTHKNAAIGLINQKLNKILKDNLSKEEASIRSMQLQPLKEIHRDERFGNFNNHTISNLILNALSVLAIFILVIAGLNFSSNLIAQAIKHNKETSIRRIVGCKKIEIFGNFFLEALILTIIASVLGLCLAFFIFKAQANIISLPQEYYMHFGLKSILTLVSIIISISVLASIFPGLFFTSKPALAVLKQSERNIITNKNIINKAIIVVQFFAAFVLLISTIAILKQLDYIDKKDLGYNPENIITAYLPDNSPSKISALSARLKECSAVKGVSFCSGNPAEAHSWFGVRFNYKNEQIGFDSELKQTDTSFFQLNEFKLLAGRIYSENDGFSTALVNNEFLTESGIKNPAELIGIRFYGASQQGTVVVGIINDSHSSSLHQRLRPCVYINNNRQFQEIEIKLNPLLQEKGRNVGLTEIASIWKEIFPEESSGFTYLTDQISNYYKKERNLFQMFILFTIVTIFLCCLGVFGLSVYVGEQRLKEIGIRKVSGAQTYQILGMLNNNYIKWILLSFLFACPAAFFLMNAWLQNFAYKTELSWWVFVLAGIITTVIALFVVGWQSYRAATRNPVEALRYE